MSSPVARSQNASSPMARSQIPTSPVSRVQNPASPTGSTVSNRTTIRASRDQTRDQTRDRNRNTIASPPTPSFSLIPASDPDKDDKGEGGFWNRWRGGRGGLRYSTGFSSPSSPNGTQTQGHTRSGSEFLSVRGDRSTPRMSLGISDFRQLRAENVANRRKSAGPMLTSRLSSNGDFKRGLDDRVESRDYLTPSKKRVDSGVGRISDESADSVAKPSY